MHFITLTLLMISSSLDNFIVGISYGVKKIQIKLVSNIVIAGISCLGTLFAMLLGLILSLDISKKHANIAGSSVLLLLAVYLTLSEWRSRHSKAAKAASYPSVSLEGYDELLHHPELADTDHSDEIDRREAIVLGIALSLNNIGLGIGASLIGLNPILSAVLSGLFSFVFLKLGLWIGRQLFPKFLERSASVAGILIILVLAVYNLFA